MKKLISFECVVGMSVFISAALIGSCSLALAAPAQILMIRHAEKDGGNDLSPTGVARAQALVGYFETNPTVTQFGTPVAIYAMSPNDAQDPSNRPVETVTPLAGALGLDLNSQYSKDDFAPMVAEIMNNPSYDGKMVLICWEHKKLDNIAKAFGVHPKPETYDGDVFDQVWEINFQGGEVSNFTEFGQHLMPGDSSN